mgnify:CR=1 FL=1
MPAHVRVQHPRPDLATPYVMPRNDGERKIAEIWQDLLGIADLKDTIKRLQAYQEAGADFLFVEAPLTLP